MGIRGSLIALFVLATALAAAMSPAVAQDGEAGPRRAVRFASADAPDLASVSPAVRALFEGTDTRRFVEIDPAGLDERFGTSGDVDLVLFDDVVLSVIVEEWSQNIDGEVWRAASDTATATITRGEPGLDARFVDISSGVVYRLIPVSGSVHLLAEQPHERGAELAPPEVEQPVALTVDGRVTTPPPNVARTAPPVTAGEGAMPVVDVLIWYDANALAFYGDTATAELALQSAINNGNAALTSSGSNMQFNLVGAEHVAFTPTVNGGTMLDQVRDKYDDVLDGVHARRDATNADLVAFVTDLSNFCGVAYVPSTVPSTATDSLAFSVNDVNCIGANLTMIHELAHNLGASHDVGASQPGPGLFAYSQGYVNPGLGYRTIMSYQTACAGCLRVPNFSSPTATYNGNPTGDPGKDNARTLSETAMGVAAYRPHPCPPPQGDDFEGAIDFGSAYSATFSGTNVCATLGAETYYTTTAPVQSVWVEWTAPSTGVATVSTCDPATDFDTWVTLHTPGPSSPGIFSNDDGVCPSGTNKSTLAFAATAGTLYHFSVDGVGGAEGNFTLSLEMAAPPIVILDDPCVLYDSASATAAGLAGTMSGEDVRTVQVAGTLTDQGGAATCLPAGARAAVMRISSINPLTEGNLRMTPAGVVATGGAGVVNYGQANGLNNANMVTVPLSTAGAVDIQANAGGGSTAPTTDVRLVAVAYYDDTAPTGLGFFALNPCAVTDSRPTKGADDAHDGPANDGFWNVGDALPDIDVVGDFPGGQGGKNGVGGTSGLTGCGVPASADAVLVNVVAVAPSGGSGSLSVDTGGEDPLVETTTPFAPLTPGMANGATHLVSLSGQENLSVDIDGAPGAKVKVRVEILGYYDQGATGLAYAPVTPCAAFDSRTTRGATGGFEGFRKNGIGNTTQYRVAGDAIPIGQGGVVDAGGGFGTCGVPTDAKAVLINLEAVNALREGNLWVSAAGTTTTGGVLNFTNLTPKMNNANAVVVPLDGNGDLAVEVNAGTFTPAGTDVTEIRGIVLGYFS